MQRFYCPQPDSLTLDAEESHHCLHVLRHQIGDLCTVFDGQGREWKVKITGTSAERVTFQKLAEARTPAPRQRVCLAQAITKNKSMDLIIQKATELGVSELAPLQSDRSVPQVDDDQIEKRQEKWRQMTIEAAKQCGQNYLPHWQPLRKTKAFLPETRAYGLKLIASLQPEAQPLKRILRESAEPLKNNPSIVVMIGPEGDFTPAEIGEARAQGFLPVSLGPIILRSETAAFYLLSALAYEFGE
jgi:16S rRNA (uracil1498-N3)-methyltransferase